ncbi:hypothetical protein BgiBS90_023840, partial [Biomphalaria glabrata]
MCETNCLGRSSQMVIFRFIVSDALRISFNSPTPPQKSHLQPASSHFKDFHIPPISQFCSTSDFPEES